MLRRVDTDQIHASRHCDGTAEEKAEITRW
jgi:hypothetical protein